MNHLRLDMPGGKLSDTDSAMLRSPKVTSDLRDLEEFLQSTPKYVPRNVRNQILKALRIREVLEPSVTGSVGASVADGMHLPMAPIVAEPRAVRRLCSICPRAPRS